MDLKEHIKYLKEDFSGELFALLRKIRLESSKFIWTIINLFVCNLKGLKISYSVIFYGKSYFVRDQCSYIEIGSRCIFNSDSKFNLIGINRMCMISTLQKGAKIEIGNNCGFSGTVIGAFKSVKIGNNVRFGANTLITDSDWHLDDYRSGIPAEVIIEDNVWLGINVIVLKGVTIGANSIIGANSLVTKNVPSNVVAAGNPCKVIKQLNKTNDTE